MNAATICSAIMRLAPLALLQPLACGGADVEEDWGEGNEGISYDDFAARGGGGGNRAEASITLDQADPHLGDWVTFTTTGGRLISIACYQGGLNLVYSAAQPTGTAFLLGGTSSEWLTNGGEAICWAWLYNRSLSRGFIASTGFVAGGAR